MQAFQTPFKFARGIATKNRLALAPMTNTQSHEDGRLGEKELAWIESRAHAGYGIVISAGARSSEKGQGFPGQLGAFSDEHVPGLKQLAEAVKKHSALPILQIMHAGVRAPSANNNGSQPVAPSEISLNFPGFEKPRALEEKEILAIIEDFGAAARRAVEAGFAGVELHGANGYLHTQFWSRVNNLRRDQWGGSNENRARFLLETIRKIRASVPKDFLVGVRILAEDSPNLKGFDIDDTVELVGWLNELGVDYVHLSSGAAGAKSWKYPGEEKTSLARIRAALKPSVALMVAGGINTAKDVEQALTDGADFVAVARAAIGTLEWPKKIEQAGFAPPAFPRTPAELAQEKISDVFLRYLKQHKLVKEA